MADPIYGQISATTLKELSDNIVYDNIFLGINRITSGKLLLNIKLGDISLGLREMWLNDIRECGLETAIFNPKTYGPEIGLKGRAKDLIAPLKVGLSLLKERQSGAVPMIENYIMACNKFPKRRPKVSVPMPIEVDARPKYDGGKSIEFPLKYK